MSTVWVETIDGRNDRHAGAVAVANGGLLTVLSGRVGVWEPLATYPLTSVRRWTEKP
jgi:hypothetical protein